MSKSEGICATKKSTKINGKGWTNTFWFGYVLVKAAFQVCLKLI
ncbi:hypothetical protein [Nostoc sp.]